VTLLYGAGLRLLECLRLWMSGFDSPTADKQRARRIVGTSFVVLVEDAIPELE